MSCLKICDRDDCYRTENEFTIYHIDYETSKFLENHCSRWFKSNFNDICNYCIDEINEDYQDFFIIDDNSDYL